MTKEIEGDSIKNNKPKILFWDVETSLIVATTFSLRPDYLPYDGILEDWTIISGAWKWAGEETTHHVAVTKYGNDKVVCKKLREVLLQADIIVHHNGDKFDLKKLNARLIYHGLEPLPKLVTVDTLKHVKKIAQFTSNSLNYLGVHLLKEGKVRTSEGLWMKVRTGDKDALKEMIIYNIGDVIVLEKIYNRLRPYMQNHPHVGLLTKDGSKSDCPKCGSVDLQKRGIAVTSQTRYQRLQCRQCGSWHQTTITKNK